MATFDEGIAVKVETHIYTNYKSNCYELPDDLSKFKEGGEA